MENRIRRVTLRFNSDEYKIIEKGFRKSTSQNMSEYMREILFDKTLTFTYRNRSIDDSQEELIRIRREINYIGNNFNQAVHKLNSVMGMPDAEIWEGVMVVLRDQVEPMIRETKERMDILSEIWSQK
ncbi:plasmid mobilization protein [Albibacterium indicum]|uniref:plasmid mobilization protein n=1 Tax=Albibacterium indicum TaxID=2292082 RepID=UPI001300394A|nr:plasmid mobilization relaxosome protein MobC [Pedobacter indicus]